MLGNKNKKKDKNVKIFILNIFWVWINGDSECSLPCGSRLTSPGPAEREQWAPRREREASKMPSVSVSPLRASASLPNSPTVGKNNIKAIQNVNVTRRTGNG